MKKYFLDLFSGIGGFALAAYQAGLRFDGHYFSEVDAYATKIYEKRFIGSKCLGDIRNIKTSTLPRGAWIITGGFPCQDISVAGKGAGLAGERSGLWYEYARIIEEIKPRFAIVENVGRLASKGLKEVLMSLAKIGYDAEWQDIRASDVGAPHRRERLWIIAYSNRNGQCDSAVNAEMGSSSKIDVSNFESTECPRIGRDSRKRKSKSRCGGWWKTEPRVGRVVNGISSRVDRYRLKCLGNSIVPEIAKMIFENKEFDFWRVK